MVNKKIILMLVAILSILSALVLAVGEWVPLPPNESNEEQPPQMPSTTYDSTLKIIEVTTSVDGEKDTITSSGEKISKEAKEKSDVEFEINIKNVWDKKIKDVDVTVIIEDIDNGDDLDNDVNINELEPGDSKKVKVNFDLPLRVDDDTYNIKIDVRGKDESNSLHIANWALKLEVKKEKNNVAITEASIYPSIVSCYRSANLDVKILNLGREKEETKIEIRNDILGINLKEEKIELGKGTDKSAEYEKTFGLKIPTNVKSGSYPIKIMVYYNKGKLLRTKELNLVVEDCKQLNQQKQTLSTLPPSLQEIISTKQKSQLQSIIYTYEEPIILFSIVILIILLGLIIFLVGAIVIKLRR